MENALTLTNLTELAAACDRRREKLATREGQASAAQEMIRLFEYIEASGYKLPLRENRQTLARVWAEQLAECIITYGFQVLRDSVKEFIATDSREYRQAPNAYDIKAIAKSKGFNPKRELAIRRNEEAEARRLAEAKAKADEWAKNNPEKAAEYRQKWNES